MKTSDLEDAKLMEDTIKSMFQQFGTMDSYTKLVLETIFETYYEDKNDLSILSETRQKRDQNSYGF
jgi:hypothetical protein